MRMRLHLVRTVDEDVWRCAREAIPEHSAVLVELSADGVSGWGEAPAFMISTYDSALKTLVTRLRNAAPLIERCDPREPEATWRRLAPVLGDSLFARSAVDVAAHDLAARLAGQPLWRHLNLPDPRGRSSSFSIGLDTRETMVAKLVRHPGWSAYKVKLAGPGQLDVLRTLRDHTSASFWIDGNACWNPADLFPVLPQLTELGVTALEQPFPVSNVGAQRELLRVSPVPVFADESVTTEGDLDARVADFHGVNIKVIKAGGITPALRMLHRCRANGVATSLGCLPETSAGASAAAHLAGLADHVDLDTVALLAIDTGRGVLLNGGGRIELPDRPGSGFLPDPASPAWLTTPPLRVATRVRA